MTAWNGSGSGRVLSLDDPDALLQASKRNAQLAAPSAVGKQDYLKQLKDHREYLNEQAWASLKTKDYQSALTLKNSQELLNAKIEEEQRKEDMVKDVEANLRREALERKEKEAAARGDIVLMSAKKDYLSQLKNELTELRLGAKVASEKQITTLRAEIMRLEQEIEDAKTRSEIEKFYGKQSSQREAIENSAEADAVDSFLAGVSYAGVLENSLKETAGALYAEALEPTPPLEDMENFASWQDALQQARRMKGRGKGKLGSTTQSGSGSLARSCYACGAVFPTATAKFCAECGAKRGFKKDDDDEEEEEQDDNVSPAIHWAKSNRNSSEPSEARTKRVQRTRDRLRKKQLQERISELMDELELVEDALLDLADTCGSEKMAMEEQQEKLKATLLENQRALAQLGDIAEDDDDETLDDASDVD